MSPLPPSTASSPDSDPERTFSPSEQQSLTRRLNQLAVRVRTHDAVTQSYTVGLICEWHKMLFSGIRDHAGRMRSPDFGDEHLIFGPNRSAHRDETPAHMQTHIVHAEQLAQQLRELQTHAEPQSFTNDCIRAALYIHADLIRIHPFVDGNGRVSRLAMNYWLIRLGLPPLTIEVPKAEYLRCMNAYLATHDMQPLIDLALRLYQSMLRKD